MVSQFFLIEDDALHLCECESDQIIKADASFDVSVIVAYINKQNKSFLELSEKLNYKNYLFLNKGYLRNEMPQISADDIDDVVAHFGGKEIAVTKVKIRLRDLKPAQIEFNDDKVMSMARNGLPDRTFVVSSDNYLVDGHHGWAGGLEIDDNHYVDCYVINLPIEKLINRANRMNITHKKDVDGNILKSYHLGYGDIFKAEAGTWSEKLRDKYKPARWITYRGSKLLIKQNGDGTANVVYSKNPAFEHLKLIPKTSEEYKKIKKKVKRVKEETRKESKITDEQVASALERFTRKNL